MQIKKTKQNDSGITAGGRLTPILGPIKRIKIGVFYKIIWFAEQTVQDRIDKEQYLISYNHSAPIKTSSQAKKNTNMLQDTFVAYFGPKLNIQLCKDVKFWPGMQTDTKHLQPWEKCV